jgi:hypothetical protein
MSLPVTRALPKPPPERFAKVFQLLLDVNAHRSVGAVLRVAGGWVRDQFLQNDSHDIDIAIGAQAPGAVITGEVFAKHIAEFQKEKGLPTSTISVVRTNPERSKHIETAQMVVLDLPLEFCHLRADDYSTISRIPSTRPGTPREDALRRDYTVNSLFYNLHTQLVEDWTGTPEEPGAGFRDLQNRVLRCPLEPRETFVDDPLRLLRGIRFAGQLGFQLDQSVLRCVTEFGSELIPVIQQKISRERIGIEVEKMLGGRDPTRCMELLHDTAVLYTVMLVEYYYMLTSAEGKPVIGNGPTKAVLQPNKIVSLFPSILDEAFAELTPEQRERRLTAQSAVKFRSTTLLREVASVVLVPPGDARACCTIYSFIPQVLQATEPSFPTSLSLSRVEVERSRLTAILGHSLKLPFRIPIAVGKMLEVHALLDPVWDELMHQLKAGMTATVGAPREAIYLARKLLRKEDSSLFASVVAFLCIDRLGGTGGASWKELYAALSPLLTRDGTMESLLSANGQRLKGNQIGKDLGIANRFIGVFLDHQEKFLIHRPDATDSEIVEHLRQFRTADSEKKE